MRVSSFEFFFLFQHFPPPSSSSHTPSPITKKKKNHHLLFHQLPRLPVRVRWRLHRGPAGHLGQGRDESESFSPGLRLGAPDQTLRRRPHLDLARGGRLRQGRSDADGGARAAGQGLPRGGRGFLAFGGGRREAQEEEERERRRVSVSLVCPRRALRRRRPGGERAGPLSRVLFGEI